MVQLQMELGQTERARDNLGAEVTRLTLRVERMEALEEDLRNMKKAYQDTEQKYQTMLTVSLDFVLFRLSGETLRKYACTIDQSYVLCAQ